MRLKPLGIRDYGQETKVSPPPRGLWFGFTLLPFRLYNAQIHSTEALWRLMLEGCNAAAEPLRYRDMLEKVKNTLMYDRRLQMSFHGSYRSVNGLIRITIIF